MLSYEEFQNEKNVADNLQTKTKKELGGLKKKKLHVKLKHFNKQKEEDQKNRTILSDLGRSNYYDRYNGNRYS